MRGGSSKGVFFHTHDLPQDPEKRDQLLLQVLGSPDPYQRQLNGMGGGVSSVSKAVLIAPSTHPEADIAYTFGQVAVNHPLVDYSTTCGNLSAAVGPFAVDEGLIQVPDGEVLVRIYDVNTAKIFHAHFSVENQKAKVSGDLEIPGVAGTGAPIRLEFINPGGSATARLLPSQEGQDVLSVGVGRELKVSLVDASVPVVFVRARDLGCSGQELPDVLESEAPLMQQLDEIRRKGGVLMGLAEHPQEIPLGSPKIAMISAPADYQTIGGETIFKKKMDIAIRMVSMERVHRAVTLTGSMCLATACQIQGTLPQETSSHAKNPIRIGTPSGVLTVGANVTQTNGEWHVFSTQVFRTARRLMEGSVLVPEETFVALERKII